MTWDSILRLLRNPYPKLWLLLLFVLLDVNDLLIRLDYLWLLYDLTIVYSLLDIWEENRGILKCNVLLLGHLGLNCLFLQLLILLF